MKIILTFLIIIIAVPVMALDNGNKEKTTNTTDKEQIAKNTSEDIGGQVQLKYGENVSNINYEENAETMASWHIAQSIPKSEKVCKKEEHEQNKIERKIIRKEKKECRKLRHAIKKEKLHTNSNL
jgi:hypothetical protein